MRRSLRTMRAGPHVTAVPRGPSGGARNECPRTPASRPMPYSFVMSIPDFQSLMLPVLELLGDGQERRTVPDVTGQIAAQSELTPEDHQRMLLSGSQSIYVNRIHWAVTYLTKASLLRRPTRGRVQITDLGLAALAKKPTKINIASCCSTPIFRLSAPNPNQTARETETRQLAPSRIPRNSCI